MLKQLQKFFAGSPAQPASAETQEEDVNMTQTTEQPNLAADNPTAELSAQLATVTTTLANLQASFTELTTKYEQAQAALNASEDAQKALATQAAAKRLEARTEAIKAAVGTSQLDSLLSATEGMADEQFNVIVSAMAKSFENEAKGPMFKEIGVAAEAPAAEVVGDSIAARLAAAIEAELKSN